MVDGEYSQTQKVGIGVAIVIGIVILVLILPFILGFKKTPRDQIGLSYGGGPFEGAHFQGIHQPGQGLFFNGLMDHLYLYPVTQRNYIISKDPKRGDIKGIDIVTAPSKDNIKIEFQTSTYFKLNLAKIQKFHEQIGLKFHAWDDKGWDQMLEQQFRPQIEFALQRESRKFNAVDLFSSLQVLQQLQHGVGDNLKDNINAVLGDEYFCGPTYVEGGPCTDFTFVINSIALPDDVVKALQDVKTSLIEIQTKKNQIAQRTAEARAIAILNRALKSQGMAYVLLKAIESGKITFWVLNGNSLTVQGPQPTASP